MNIRIANPTNTGGEVQLWPMEWQAILAVLPAIRTGRDLGPAIRARLEPGATKPVRIACTNAEIEALRRAADLVG